MFVLKGEASDRMNENLVP